MKKKAIISACLLGLDCRYDGGNNYVGDEKIKKLKENYELIPVCPEAYGGLTTPRVPSEIAGDKVVSRLGADVTNEFIKGAAAALYLAKLFDCDCAILKANSPSCGSGTVYDGTFSGTLTEGYGVTAKLLKENGICVIDENEI